MTFRRIVAAVQVVAALLTLVTIVRLAAPAPAIGAGLGAAVFGANCASCHAADGSGLVGPDLTTGHVFERFASRTEMMQFITNGFDKMPAMGERLTIGEIGAVTDFVRMELGS